MTWGINKPAAAREEYLRAHRPANAALLDLKKELGAIATMSPDDGVLDYAGLTRIVAKDAEELSEEEKRKSFDEQKWYRVGAPGPEEFLYELDTSKPVEEMSLKQIREMFQQS